MDHRLVLGMRVDNVEADGALAAIVDLAAAAPFPVGGGRYVCAANVHMTMEAHDDPAFLGVVNDAALVVADGQPMVWALKALGAPQQRRVRMAPDLLLSIFAACEQRDIALGLYGGAPDTLATFTDTLHEHYPRLRVPYAWSPPFRALTASEDADVVAAIAVAGVQLLLVGLGCPKQERWMSEHTAGTSGARTPLPCLMVGVGAAFDMLGGKTGNAPAWMQRSGLEWTYRLVQEPRRLWRRHLRNDPRFLALLARDVAASRLGR